MQWILYIQGNKGEKGDAGPTGTPGSRGLPGKEVMCLSLRECAGSQLHVLSLFTLQLRYRVHKEMLDRKDHR